MDKLPVGQLPDLQQSNNDDEIMVITNSEYSQLKKEKISDLITDFTSTNENNALTKGTDGKMFVTDFGNASNITEGTLPVDVLPESGVTADTYAYPSSVTVNAQGQVTAIEEGTPSGSNADVDLSNITEAGKEVIKENSKSGSGLEIGDIGMALYVDETKGLRRYLNGQIVDINTNTQAFLNRLKQITTLHPSLLDTEENWQAAKALSPFGQVGKFVFNYSGDEIVSVRLPRVVNVQGLFDLQNLGMRVEAGLPNITGKLGGNSSSGVYGQPSSTGAFKNVVKTYNNVGLPTGNSAISSFEFDSSESNPIYGNSSTVQQEAIQYPYFIQVATGQETENNIINEIELNNPFSLFDSKYSDHELNNLSWLKSEGQWNAKAVYPTAYDKLLKVYNGTETVEGLSVKLSTETYTDYDFVLNTTDETFRLPLKTKLASGKAVVGNGMTLGLTNGSNKVGIFYTDYLQARDALYGSTIGTQYSGSEPTNGKSFGVTTDPTKSGIETSDSDLYLYFYVGETVQNANLINAGRIEEQLATKTDMQQAANASMPSTRYIDLTLGASGSSYTAPADGWVCLMKQSTGASQYVAVDQIIDGKHFRMMSIATANGQNIAAYLPVAKGAVFMANYSAAGALNTFRFYYAQGAKND